MRISHIVGMVWACCLLIGSGWSIASPPTDATRTFLNDRPGAEGMVEKQRLSALYGAMLAANDDPVDPFTSTDAFVYDFLFTQNNKDALGVDDVDLFFVDKVNIRNDTFSIYSYVQRIEGLRVHGGAVRFPVLLGPPQTISHISMRLFPHPASPLPADVVTDSQALSNVANDPTYQQLTTFTTPEKVIYEADDASLHRVWRFYGYNDDEGYEFFVDTNSGAIVGVENAILEADVSGTVRGYTTACCSPTDCPGCCGIYDCTMCCPADNPNTSLSCPVIANIVGAQVTLDDPIAAPDFTGADGSYTLSTDETSVTVTGRLIGEWVTVINDPGAGPDLLTEPIDPVSPPIADVDLLFNPEDPGCSEFPIQRPPEFDTAQVNAFIAATKAHDLFLEWNPAAATDINQNVVEIFVNLVGRCNAFYSPITKRIGCFRAAPECTNWASSTVVAHEYGHFVVDQLITSKLSGRVDSAFTEGVGDALAAFVWNTELMTLDWDGNGGIIRHMDDPDVQLDCTNDPNLPPVGWSCDPCKAHCHGLALAGAFWDLRKTLLCCAADADGACADNPPVPCTEATVENDCSQGQACSDRVVEELFAEFLQASLGGMFLALPELLAIDDENGGSVTDAPHYDEIFDAFVTLHGWPPPCDATDPPVVEWVGPLAPNEDPIEGEDYMVFYVQDDAGNCLPHITLFTTEKGGELIDQYIVGRSDAGGNPLDIGSVVEALDDLTTNITVVVGRPEGETPPAGSVQVVDICHPFIGDGVWGWTSIELHLAGDLIELACCNIDNVNLGGQISGEAASVPGKIRARAIGIGAADTGTFDAGTILGTAILATIPGTGPNNKSLLRVDGVTEEVAVMFDLAGDLTIDGPLLSPGTISIGWDVVPHATITIDDPSAPGLSTGSILIKGDMLGTITIHGDMDGDILINADGVGGGDLLGTITVGGELNGNVVADNVVGGAITIDDPSAPGRSTGNILIQGDIVGTITIHGAMDGDILINADGVGGGDLLGTITVTGVFNGNVCADNLCPAFPPSTINFGPDGTVCGVVPGASDSRIALLDVEPNGFVKNRFITFAPVTGNEGQQTAIRVRIITLYEDTSEDPVNGCPVRQTEPDLNPFEGQYRWVGPPVKHSKYVNSIPENLIAAKLQCCPYFHDWGPDALAAEFGTDADTSIVHVYGEAIVPCSEYELQVVHASCADHIDDESAFTDVTLINTALWGDVWMPFGTVNFTDVGAVVDGFKDVLSGAPKVHAMLRGNTPPVGVAISFTDVGRAVEAFKSIAYPEDGPSSCDPCP